MIAFLLAAMIAAVQPSLGVNVDDPTGDPAAKFAARDVVRLLAGLNGTVALRIDPSLENQRWRIVSDGKGTVTVSGRDGVAIAYGVFTYLEKHCGVRWFAFDTETTDRTKGEWCRGGIGLSSFEETGRPAILDREMYVGEDFLPADWRFRNKETRRAMYSAGTGVGSPRDNHTYAYYNEVVQKRLPELYDGRRKDSDGRVWPSLCWTDERTRDIVAEEMCRLVAEDRKRLAGKPLYSIPTVYDLSQDDGWTTGCYCDGCRKLVEENGSFAGPNIAFANAVAERVAKKYPDVMVQTFAYGFTDIAPTGSAKAADNVIVRYCRSSIDSEHSLTPGTASAKNFDVWKEHAKNFCIWSYWRTYRGILFPYVVPRERMAAHLRYCRDAGVIRYFCENESPLSKSFAMMQHWLFLKLAENPDQDVNALSDEFLKGYYGKSADVMRDYLKFVEDCGEPTKRFLTRAFFEKANALLDAAEEAVRDDPRSLDHIRWERTVVDRTMYDNLGRLLKEGFTFDKEKVAKRFDDSLRKMYADWPGWKYQYEPMRQKRLKAAADQARLFAHYPIAVPKEFDGLDAYAVEWPKMTWGDSVLVSDADAAAGTAFYSQEAENKGLFKLPYGFGVYHGVLKQGHSLDFKTKADVPQDEKFHLYKLGRMLIMSGMYFWYSPTWNSRQYQETLGIIPEERDVWISVKFQGPAFVEGSTLPNRVLFDRAFFVKGDSPTRGYRTAGGNLLGNGGFEKGYGDWAVIGGKEGVAIDAAERKSGTSSLKVSGITDGFRAVYRDLGDLNDWKGGTLLVRGWVKFDRLEAGNSNELPFVGLWAIDDGKNSFSVNCVTVYPGTYDWAPFEAVIDANRIRRNAAAMKGKDRRLLFRINVSKQSGTLWLDDLEVVPLVREGKGQ